MTDYLDDYLNKEWFAMPEDTIGGWCVKANEIPPSESYEGEVACFISEEIAKHVAELHNMYLRIESFRAEALSRR
jgi:hypothetical protein